MGIAYALYLLMTTLIFIFFLPFLFLFSKLTGLYFKGIHERLGLYNLKCIKPVRRPCIWIHAVSLGEVIVAEAIINVLVKKNPTVKIIVSVTTPHGKELAQERLKTKAVIIFAPLDFIFTTLFAMKAFSPDVIAFVETEIWPNWLMTARRLGIGTVFINGRLSVRSISRYRKIKSLLIPLLRNVDGFSMIRNEDANRIKELGADPEKVRICGNAKFDQTFANISENKRNKLADIYQVEADQRIIIGGSVRGNEHEMLISCFQNLIDIMPDLILIIAPRHLKKITSIEKYLKKKQIPYQLRTDLGNKDVPRSARIILLNQFGELRHAYGLASVAFCGGSMVPTGGQNALEAAVWGVPVVYGPHMEDFPDAEQQLKRTGGGICVNTILRLENIIKELLTDTEKRKRIGHKARNAALMDSGAAEAHAQMIIDLLKKRSDPIKPDTA